MGDSGYWLTVHRKGHLLRYPPVHGSHLHVNIHVSGIYQPCRARLRCNRRGEWFSCDIPGRVPHFLVATEVSGGQVL
jgi:hypothetical protein